MTKIVKIVAWIFWLVAVWLIGYLAVIAFQDYSGSLRVAWLVMCMFAFLGVSLLLYLVNLAKPKK
jgi:hypothetical protein